MEKDEKVDYILYQMRLVLARKDFVRSQIIAKKIQKKTLEAEGFEKLKVRYYHLWIEYCIHEKMHMETARGFQTIYDAITSVPKDKREEMGFTESQVKYAFQNSICFLLICPFDPQREDFLNTINTKYARELESHPALEDLVHKFLAKELMPFDEGEISKKVAEFGCFDSGTTNHSSHLKSFFKQVIQHNLRVIELYYNRISLERLSHLI